MIVVKRIKTFLFWLISTGLLSDLITSDMFRYDFFYLSILWYVNLLIIQIFYGLLSFKKITQASFPPAPLILKNRSQKKDFLIIKNDIKTIKKDKVVFKSEHKVLESDTNCHRQKSNVQCSWMKLFICCGHFNLLVSQS